MLSDFSERSLSALTPVDERFEGIQAVFQREVPVHMVGAGLRLGIEARLDIPELGQGMGELLALSPYVPDQIVGVGMSSQEDPKQDFIPGALWGRRLGEPVLQGRPAIRSDGIHLPIRAPLLPLD
jgi:hypothetical protein